MRLRDELSAVGLGRHADALIALALPSIQLERSAGAYEKMLARPPTAVWGLAEAALMIAGCGHNLVLRTDGSVVAWGYNECGQLGDGTTKYRRSPVPVRDLTDVTAISAGMGHSLALTSSGGVLAWGSNRYGQLGDGTQDDRHVPVPVQRLQRNVIAIVAGDNVSLALTYDGSVLSWGGNHITPTPVRGLESGIVAIAAGSSHRLALTSDGSVLAWGSAHSLALGRYPADPSEPPYNYGPAPVEGLPTGIVAITAGMFHNLALTADGAVLGWGRNLPYGALGDGSVEDRFRPGRVTGLDRGVRTIAAGYNCSYAIRDDGSLLSWGWNYEGLLGDGGTADRLTPTPVPALKAGVVAVSQGLALMDDGSVRAWGGQYPADGVQSDARLDLAAMKLGGRPDLRPRSRWPSVGGRPLAFVAQIDLAQLAPLDSDGQLPPAGLLSFFYGVPAGPLDGDSCEVIFSEPGSPLTRREFPDGLPDHERFTAVGMTARGLLTLPPAAPSFLTAEEQGAYDEVRASLEPEPSHQLLGHPDIVQSDPRQATEALLLQVDSDTGTGMTWGDVGRVYYLISREDLLGQRFKGSRCELQSH